MADYWKSTGKKYCDFCKCWTADNKASIEFHERGKNHQANVKRRLSEIKKNSIDKRKKDETQKRMFEDMEKAALAAVQKDISGSQVAVGKSDLKNIVSAHSSSSNSNNETYPWTEMTAPQGFTYYYNALTGESSWSMPEVFKKIKERKEKDARESTMEPPKLYHNDRRRRFADPHREEEEVKEEKQEKQIIEEVSEEVHNVHPLLGGWSTVTRYEVEPDDNTEQQQSTSETEVAVTSEETTKAGDDDSTNNDPERKVGKKFKERVIKTNITTSDESVSFKKRKTKVRNVRKREDDE